MSLTRAFRTAQQANPTWGYKELAEFLLADINTLRGLNSRLKLPIPVRQKAPKGESKSANGDRRPYSKKVVSAVSRMKPAPGRKSKPIPTVSQTGSGRKQYGSYLKLL